MEEGERIEQARIAQVLSEHPNPEAVAAWTCMYEQTSIDVVEAAVLAAAAAKHDESAMVFTKIAIGFKCKDLPI